jgi:hypothetical protein
MTSKEITDSEKILCALISGLSEQSGYCYASNDKLASSVNKSTNAVKAIIKRLYAKDILINKGTKDIRKLVLDYIKSDEKKDINNGCQIDTLKENKKKTKCQIDTSRCQIDTSTLLYINNNKDGQMTKSDQTKSLDTSSLSFSSWYKLYPKKLKRLEQKIYLLN